jgi:magnesium-transporting ATPase (P-type)
MPASRRLHEIPFDSDRMRQTVVQQRPEGPRLYCKGAPESIPAISAFSFSHGQLRPLDAAARATIVQAQESMAARGLRVLAFATRDLPTDWSREGLESNLVFRGLVALRDPPRPEVPHAIDMVLLDDNFASIVNAIEEGRAVFENIRKFLTYVLVHNVAELVPYLAFVLFRIPLALTPIQILMIDMGTDSLTGLGLGVERAGSADHAPAASPTERAAHDFAGRGARLPVPRADRGGRRNGGFLSRARCWRLDLWRPVGLERSPLPARHHSLPLRVDRHADCQRIPLPERCARSSACRSSATR